MSCEIAAEDGVVSLAGYAQYELQSRMGLICIINFRKSDMWTNFETVRPLPGENKAVTTRTLARVSLLVEIVIRNYEEANVTCA